MRELFTQLLYSTVIKDTLTSLLRCLTLKDIFLKPAQNVNTDVRVQNQNAEFIYI